MTKAEEWSPATISIYFRAGLFTVTVTVRDGEGGEASDQFEVRSALQFTGITLTPAQVRIAWAGGDRGFGFYPGRGRRAPDGEPLPEEGDLVAVRGELGKSLARPIRMTGLAPGQLEESSDVQALLKDGLINVEEVAEVEHGDGTRVRPRELFRVLDFETQSPCETPRPSLPEGIQGAVVNVTTKNGQYQKVMKPGQDQGDWPGSPCCSLHWRRLAATEHAGRRAVNTTLERLPAGGTAWEKIRI